MNLFMRIWGALELFFVFFWAVVVANLQVLGWIFKDNRQLTPAVITFPLGVKRDHSIAILTSMITLTPGTLSLGVSEDKKFLQIHAIHTDDPLALVADIRQSFEDRLKRIFE